MLFIINSKRLCNSFDRFIFWGHSHVVWIKQLLLLLGGLGVKSFTGSFWQCNGSQVFFSPKKVAFGKGNGTISGKSRLVKYYDLARKMTEPLKRFLVRCGFKFVGKVYRSIEVCFFWFPSASFQLYIMWMPSNWLGQRVTRKPLETPGALDWELFWKLQSWIGHRVGRKKSEKLVEN